MRRRSLAAAALALALGCAGCRSERKEDATTAPAPPAPQAHSGYEAIKPSGTGSISGTVVFRGMRRKPPPRPVGKDQATCGHGPKPSEALQVGSNGALANAVVSLDAIRRGKEPDPSPLVLDQRRCDYIPHVQAAMAGATLDILNSDDILHNVHGYLNGRETVFNIAMPLIGQKVTKTLSRPGVIKLQCDAGHTWMDAYIVVLDNPYYTVTAADGKFAIAGVPPGSYKLKTWHEQLGALEQEVAVSSGSDTGIELTFR